MTHLTDVQNTGVTYADESRNILLKPGNLPLLVRAGEARVSLSVGRGEWEVWALSTTGARRMRVPCEATEKGLVFVADVSRDPVSATLAYEVIAKDSFQTPPDSGEADRALVLDGRGHFGVRDHARPRGDEGDGRSRRRSG